MSFIPNVNYLNWTSRWYSIKATLYKADYTTFFLYFDRKILFRKKNCCISLGIPRDCIYCSTLFVYSPDQYLFSLKYLFWENKFLVTIWIFMFSLIVDVVVGNFLGHYKNFVRAFWKIKTLYYDKWNLYYVYWWING